MYSVWHFSTKAKIWPLWTLHSLVGVVAQHSSGNLTQSDVVQSRCTPQVPDVEHLARVTYGLHDMF